MIGNTHRDVDQVLDLPTFKAAAELLRLNVDQVLVANRHNCQQAELVASEASLGTLKIRAGKLTLGEFRGWPVVLDEELIGLFYRACDKERIEGYLARG